MIRKIIPASDPVLRKKAKPVKKITKSVKKLVKDLKDTLKAQTDPEGVGLAAPQIGVGKRVFIMNYDDKITTVISPKVLSIDKSKKKKSTKTMEGCLSIPHHYGPLTRPKEITIKYLNEKGKSATKTFKGFEAQIIQHEIDHLDGVLFVDHLLKEGKPLYELVDDEWVEVDI